MLIFFNSGYGIEFGSHSPFSLSNFDCSKMILFLEKIIVYQCILIVRKYIC